MSAVETIIIAGVMALYVVLLTLLALPWKKWKQDRARETLHLLAEIGRVLRDERRTAASVAVGEALIRVCKAREKAGRP